MAQVVERGYAVSEVAQRLGISTKSLYAWKAQFSKSPRLRAEGFKQAAEIKRLKRELARLTEERNILKKGDRVLRARVSVRCAFIHCPAGYCPAMHERGGSSARVFGVGNVPCVAGPF